MRSSSSAVHGVSCLSWNCQDFLLQVLLRVNKDVFHQHRCFKDKHNRVTRPPTTKLNTKSLGAFILEESHGLPATCCFCELRNSLTVGESGVRGHVNVDDYI